MKSAGLICNRPLQLLIYSLHGKHLHTLSVSLLLVLHIISSSLPNFPPLLHCLPPLFPQTLFSSTWRLLAGLKLSQLLFSCVVICSMAHAHAFPPSSFSPPAPSLSSSHCSCSSHLFSCSLCFCVLHPWPDFYVTQKSRVEEKLRLCVCLCVRLT